MIRTVERLDDGSLEIVAEIAAGADTRLVRVPLGRFEHEIDPGGLRNTPVVVLSHPVLEATVRAGVTRAGQASVARLEPASGSFLGAELLGSSSTAEVLLVVAHGSAGAAALVVTTALGGRPLPVIPLDDPAGARALLQGCDVDLDIAVPSVDGPLRGLIRGVVDQLGLFIEHHVVEVDPRPALPDADIDGGVAAAGAGGGPSLHELAAAATGVLAGRVAAGNRRWR